ncbi:MAG: hypothetical protein MRQ09_02865 [Candidatus Midichloria sp.]|nr:hypothetical protein [Candidatus Midichloria sp.]
MKDENSKKIAAKDIADTVNKFYEQKNISGEFPNLQGFSRYVSLNLNSDNSSLIARYETALIQAFDKSPELRSQAREFVNHLLDALPDDKKSKFHNANVENTLQKAEHSNTQNMNQQPTQEQKKDSLENFAQFIDNFIENITGAFKKIMKNLQQLVSDIAATINNIFQGKTAKANTQEQQRGPKPEPASLVSAVSQDLVVAINDSTKAPDKPEQGQVVLKQENKGMSR